MNPGAAGLQAATDLEELFEVPVSVCSARVEELPSAALPAVVRAEVDRLPTTARRATYAAGRLAAARATEMLTGTAHWVPADPRGAPVWPRELTGSLSHTGDLAVCVAARAATVRLGIDIEPLRSAVGLREAAKLVCTREERRLVASACDPELAVLRVFCAKEALFKSLPPELQAGWSFPSASLRSAQPLDSPVPLALVVDDGSLRATITTVVVGDLMAAGVVLR